jgi:tetratricopeptide (TPR) repeat protein
LSDVYFRLGVLYEQEWDFQDVNMALTMYDKALDFGGFGYEGNHAQAYYRRGVIYEEIEHELVKAIAQYRKALDIFPEHSWAKLRLGYALYREYKSVTLAEDILRKIISSQEDNVYQKFAYQYLGDIYMIENRPLDAIAAYRQVLTIDPTDEKVTQLLTDLLAEQKK